MGESVESFARLSLGDEILEVTRKNLILNRHLGKFAVYDHCFVHAPQGGGGAYLWVHQPGFEKYENLAYEHHARINLNIEKATDLTMRNYLAQATEDLEDAFTLPEEWLRQG